jgi:hypothetical protein
VATLSQSTVDYIADNLELEVAVRDNGHVPVDVLFRNAGNETIPTGFWKIFFYK